jgi:hypothetical protein
MTKNSPSLRYWYGIGDIHLVAEMDVARRFFKTK